MQIAQADFLGLNSKFSKLLSANIWWKRVYLKSLSWFAHVPRLCLMISIKLDFPLFSILNWQYLCNILLQFVKFTDFTDSRVLHVTVGSSVAFTAVNILIEVMVVVVGVMVVVVVVPIPDICHIFYTTTIWGLEILHLKVRKFT